MKSRYLVVTIDTEVDKDSSWNISNPVRFTSITQGIGDTFSPLFDKYRVKPSYLLSPEVIENDACVRVLQSLGPRAELGTHLHPELIEPQRSLFPGNMAGRPARAIQMQYSPEVEEKKLTNLTELFRGAFGYSPLVFRAGRYGLSSDTLAILAKLGYRVDSSVTPGLRWAYDEGLIDYRHWSPTPRFVQTKHGAILEAPISIIPGHGWSSFLQTLPPFVWRAGGRLLQRLGSFRWLRPTWAAPSDLVHFVQASMEPVLVLMMHSMEIIPGASPCVREASDVQRLLSAMEELFVYWRDLGHEFCGLADLVQHV